MKIVIGSRKSALARIQAYRVAEAMTAEAARLGIELELEFLFKSSMGDLQLDVSLKELPEKGVFTKDLQEDLKAGRCDCVVHSWKDLPVELPEGHRLVGTLEREDAHDVLLLKSSCWRFASGVSERAPTFTSQNPLCILSSSPRREHNLQTLLPELLPFEGLAEPGCLSFKEIRGNIPTRVSKMLADPDAHGLILAKAALDRLMAPLDVEDEEVTSFQEQLAEDLKQCEWMILPIRENPPAPAQGALAIETLKAGDRGFEEKLALIQSTCAVHEDVAGRVHQERRVLSRYGGGCHQKIGAHVFAAPDGKDLLCLRGETQGKQALHFEGSFEDWEQRFGDASQTAAPLEDSSDEASDSSSHEARESASIWPSTDSSLDSSMDSSLFERVDIDLDLQIADTSKASARTLLKNAEHWILGRSNCWTDDVSSCFLSLSRPPRVWVSGARSWRSLARQGVWVSGSLESLGASALSLSEWTQNSRLADAKLVKLTHSNQTAKAGIGAASAEPVGVYALNPRFEGAAAAADLLPAVVLPGKDTKYYYWMSASQLHEVLRLCPDLWDNSRKAGAVHACGMGQSFQELKPLFEKEKITLECHLSQEHFLQSHGVSRR